MHDRTNPSPAQAMPPAAKHGPVVEWERVRTPTPPATLPAPWVTSAQDPDRAVTNLSNRFPAATIWFGEHAGSYRALTHTENGTPRLNEAATPAELNPQLDSVNHLRQPQRRAPSALQSDATNPTTPHQRPETHPSSLHRSSRGRVRCRGRHSATRTLSRSGRC